MDSKLQPITEFINLKKWLNNVSKLKEDSDKIFIAPEGEDVLVSLLQAEKELGELKEQVKAKLEESALKLNPNFSSIQGDKIKVYYREYGSKYYVDESQFELIPDGLVNTETKYSVDSKAVEKWSEEHGGMPTGIKEVERGKTLSISLKANGKAENNS